MEPEYPMLRANTIVDSASGKAYYVLVKLSEDKMNFETSSLELRVTDGRCCWSKEGLHRQPAPREWMRNVYSALSGSNRSAYDIQIQSSSDEMKVIIRWHEADLRVRASVALPAAEDENALPSMLSTLFKSFAAMQEAHAELAELEGKFRRRADSSQSELQELVESKEKREQELYIKFAAVVNEKKQKLRDLQRRVQELENMAQGDPDQEDASGAGSPPRMSADAEHDSIYDASTEPSAGNSEFPGTFEDENEATQQRPAAGTFGINDTDAAEGEAHDQDDGRAATTRSQAERDALLSAETQPVEPEQEEDEEMQNAPQEEPAPAARPPSKPGGLAKRRRR